MLALIFRAGLSLVLASQALALVGLNVVTTTTDEFDTPSSGGSGISLREAIRDASTISGSILFDPSLSGKTITLTLGQLTITQDLAIDATSLPNGICIDGGGNGDFIQDPGESRCFFISDGTSSKIYVGFFNLTIQNGSFSGSNAGANVFNDGENLNIVNCQILGGRAFGNDADGGGIYNAGGCMIIESSTIADNQCSGTNSDGGGIYSETNLTTASTIVAISTLSGNQTINGRGGAIFNASGNSSIIYGTLTLNTASAGQGSALASAGDSLTSTTLTGCIISGNTNSDLDLVSGATNSISSSGYNLAGSGTGISSLNQTGDQTGISNPLLAPLACYGGPTQSHYPLPGSPAIDAAGTTNPGGTDQRIFSRFLDGDGDGTVAVDVGAVEASNIEVSTTVDEDNGSIASNQGAGISLREALEYAEEGSLITFDSSVSFQSSPIVLTLGQLEIDKDLYLDASNISGQVTVDANGSVTGHRVFLIQNEAKVTLQNLHLTGGSEEFDGGCIYNNLSTLNLNNCTLSNNSAEIGGGIYNNGFLSGTASLALNGCLLSNNHAAIGGSIFSSASLSLTSCTVSENTADETGGGIHYQNSLGAACITLKMCTVTNNSSPLGGGIFCQAQGSKNFLSLQKCTISNNFAVYEGGGLYCDHLDFSPLPNSIDFSVLLDSCTITENSAKMNSGGGIHFAFQSSNTLFRMQNSILARNFAPSGPDLWEDYFFGPSSHTFIGNNLLSSIEGSNISEPPPAEITLVSDPLLSPLGDYGGPTMTVLPLPGSPALDAASSSTDTADQRGFPRLAGGTNDIGAAELQPELTGFLDSDNDQMDDRVEPLYGYDPTVADGPNDPASRLRIVDSSASGADLAVIFETWPGRQHCIERGPNLDLTDPDSAIPGTSSDFFRSAVISPTSGTPLRYFGRIKQD